MGENRIRVDRELIQGLLNCSSYEEKLQLLQANLEQLNSGILQEIEQVAVQMAAIGDRNAVGLTSIANWISIRLILTSASTTAKEKFLKQVLQVILDSQGNPQVVFPLLQVKADRLDDEFKQTLQDWATQALAKVEPQQAQVIATILFELGKLIQQFSFGDKDKKMETAIAANKKALQVFTREAFPQQWAKTQISFANAYLSRIRGDKAQNLEQAIECCQKALQVFTREDFPQEWAKTQYNLGTIYLPRIQGNKAENLERAIELFNNAFQIFTCTAFAKEWAMIQNNLATVYLARIRGEKAENLEQAIECYDNALQVYPREVYPQDWARTQSNLANAYLYRVRGEKADNLEQAIEFAQNALQIFTREVCPQDWARTQDNLGLAYKKRIRGDKTQNLERVIECYQNARQVRTREAFPQDWAATQNNLAKAYSARTLGDKAENLEKTIDCYQNVLQVRTREALPTDWATTHISLAVAYSDRTLGNKAENLERAIECCQKALQVFTREAFPQQWAATQNGLARTYLSRIQGNKAENLERAINCYENALQVRTRETFSQDWAMIQNNLAIAYYERIRGDKAQNLERAIECYQNALQVRTREAFPQNWAMTQNNLGEAYRNRIRGDKAQNLERAIECCQNALQVRTREAFPTDWAATQNNLAIAYYDRIRGGKAQNLERAIECCQNALQVRTCEAFSQDWAMTQNNLANAYLNRIRGDKAQNLERAIECYENALQVFTREAFPQNWAMTQNNLGEVYRNRIRGDEAQNLERAIECCQNALQVYTRTAFPFEWAIIQNSLAVAYQSRIWGEWADNYERAIECYQKALQVRTREAFPQDWAMTQNNLGEAYRNRIRGDKAQNLERAIKCYQNTVQVYTRTAFPFEWAKIQNNLAAAYTYEIRGDNTQNLEKAIKHYENAVQVYTREAFPQEHMKILFNRGLTYRDAQQWQQAYNSFSAAIDTVESLREEILSGNESKQKFAEEWTRLYFRMVETCVKLNLPIKALEYAERSKTRNLIEQILLRDSRSIFPPDVANQLTQLRNDIASTQYQIQQGNVENYAELAQCLQDLRWQRNQLQNTYLSIGSSFRFDSFQSTLNRHTVIIEWYITLDTLLDKFFAFIILPPSLSRSERGSEVMVWQSTSDDFNRLSDWFNIYLNAYSTERNTWRNKLVHGMQELAEILHLDELLAQIPASCKHLMLIPHFFLHLLPFHALPVSGKTATRFLEPHLEERLSIAPTVGDVDGCPQTKSYYLLDIFPKGVSYAPSCQLLSQVQKRKRPQFTNLFAIQNPTEDLFYTNLEVEAIRSFFDSAKVLAKQAATKTALNASSDFTSAHCIHFSCHGKFNLESPLESTLFLAHKERLTLSEIFRLNLDECRLITLSACETGLVDFTNLSDEYIGLPNGFLYAGSLSVVSSLWTVDDLSTSLLMIKFYENLHENLRSRHNLKEGDVAVALNQAQSWLRDLTLEQLEAFLEQYKPLVEKVRAQLRRGQRLQFDEYLKQIRQRQPLPFTHPYYWAAFIATGI